MTALLALCASAVWGASDFLGGILAKRMPALAVVFVSQGATVAVLVLLALAGVAPLHPQAWWGWAASAGAVGAFALAAFYRALASGVMGVVAPIASTGVCVPVLTGLASGEQPRIAQLAGIGTGGAGGGVRRRSRARRRRVGARRPRAGRGRRLRRGPRPARPVRDQQVAGTLLVQKGSQFAVMGLVVLAVRKPVPAPLRALPVVALVGWGDAAANGLYVLATRSGYLSVVAVFASLYPVATVLIARRVLHERLRRVQVLGVAVGHCRRCSHGRRLTAPTRAAARSRAAPHSVHIHSGQSTPRPHSHGGCSKGRSARQNEQWPNTEPPPSAKRSPGAGLSTVYGLRRNTVTRPATNRGFIAWRVAARSRVAPFSARRRMPCSILRIMKKSPIR